MFALSLLKAVVFIFQTKVEDLSALDMLSEDFVSTTKASGVQASAPPATKKKTPEVKLLLCVCLCVCVCVCLCVCLYDKLK